MPNYCYICTCKAPPDTFERCLTMEELARHEPPACRNCGGPMWRDYAREHAPRKRTGPVWPVVTDEVTGEPMSITSWSDWERKLAEHGKVPYTGGAHNRDRERNWKDYSQESISRRNRKRGL